MKLLMKWYQIPTEFTKYKLYWWYSGIRVVRTSTGIEIKQYEDRDGYIRANLIGDDGKSYNVGIHVLVCLVFKGPRPKGKRGETVNHKNGCKWDNHPSNLEWKSRKGTSSHAARIGLYVKGKDHPWWGSDHTGENNGNSKLIQDKAVRILRLWKTGRYSQRELGRIFGVSQYPIWAIVNNRTWKV